MSGFVHRTVLLNEVIALLAPRPGQRMFDGTLGGGGHAEGLLEAGVTLVGVDRDPQALAAAKRRLARFGSRLELVHGRFAEALSETGDGAFDGLVLDLGVSSPQFDVPERGFSFSKEGPLDMRMGAEGETAADLIATASVEVLEEILSEFGEERFARSIARRLKERLPQTTTACAQAVGEAVPRKFWPKDIHVATRTFQALRIAVNRELAELDAALTQIPRCLKPGGRAAIISFHSLEDRRVKTEFKRWSRPASDALPRGLRALTPPVSAPFVDLTPKAQTASPEEVADNPRARSAKLRAVEKRV